MHEGEKREEINECGRKVVHYRSNNNNVNCVSVKTQWRKRKVRKRIGRTGNIYIPPHQSAPGHPRATIDQQVFLTSFL